MRTIEVNLYKFNELDDDAKEKARDWYRGVLEFDPEFVIDDFTTIGEILGIEFDYKLIPLVGGGTRPKPNIYYSGFYSQGDGACFEGTYRYKNDACEAIRKHAPQDEELARIADALKETQAKYKNRIEARVEHRGQYSHEHSVVIDCSLNEYDLDDDGNEIVAYTSQEDDDTMAELLRDLMRWLYRRLGEEYEYQFLAEVVDEAIIANEYEFTEEGRIA